MIRRSSSALAAAYGIAVTGTMSITTIVYYVVATRTWGWPVWKALPLAAAFLAVDLAFFGSTAVKFMEGGWFPVLMATGIFVVMTTWNTGRRHLAQVLAAAPVDTVDVAALVAKGLGTRKDVKIKILNKGDITKPLTVHAHAFSASAVAAIEAAGGTATVVAL